MLRLRNDTFEYDLLQELGSTEAIVLHFLRSWELWPEQEPDDLFRRNAGFFPLSRTDMQKWLKMTDAAQSKALKRLSDKGLIEIKKMGMPARRHVRIKHKPQK